MSRLEMFLDQMRQHAGYALRQLARSPGLTAAVTLTLGLGIGANATMFGVIDRLLLSPPAHVRDAHEVRRVLVSRSIFGARRTMFIGSFPSYMDVDAAESFVEIAAYNNARTQTFGRGLDASQAAVVSVTASFFPLLGVRPAAGRFFTEAEDRAGQPNRAVLGYAFWRRHYSGDVGVLGEVIKLDDLEYTIVGVAPKGFTGVDISPVDVWLNLHAMPGNWAETRNILMFNAVARLRPEVPATLAEEESTLLLRHGNAEAARSDPDSRVVLAPLIAARGPGASAESSIARWLAGVGVVVLLIACANIANLLLERALNRRREIAVRLALGNSRLLLIRQLLTESLVLALLGGTAGLLVAGTGGVVLRNVLVTDVEWVGSAINFRVLVFSTFVTVMAGLVMGLLPALQSVRTDINQTLKSGEHGSRHGGGTRVGLMLGQVALSVVLLMGAGLFVRSVAELRNLDMGVDPDGLLLATIELERADAGDSAAVLASTLPYDAVERLSAMPEVERSALSFVQPFRGRLAMRMRVPGLDSIPAQAQLGPFANVVSAGFFDVMDMPFLRGRGFAETDDREGAEPVVVVNQTMARVLWQNADPLEQCLFITQFADQNMEHCARVIGVVADVRDNRDLLDDGLVMQYYVPLRQNPPNRPPTTLLARVRDGEAEAHAALIRNALFDLQPAIRNVTVTPFRDVIDPRYRSWILGATMFSAFGAVALLIAVVGLYSLLAFNVAQRKHELGIRVALGADRKQVVRMVMRQAMTLVVAGLALGVAVSIAAGGAIEPLLFRISARDPFVFVAVIGTLALAGLAAAVLPARRATAVDPIETLRVE